MHSVVFTSTAFIIPTISFTAFNRLCQKEISLGFHLTAGFTELSFFLVVLRDTFVVASSVALVEKDVGSALALSGFDRIV